MLKSTKREQLSKEELLDLLAEKVYANTSFDIGKLSNR